jgi:hypothetical protein
LKVIYHCYGGAHSSVTAANIHLGLLPGAGFPSYRDLVNQKLFDFNQVADSGRICFMGRDQAGNEVYIVGRRSRPTILYHAAAGLSEAFGIPKESFILVDVSPHVNMAMKAGGILSRRLGLVAIGRPLVTWGTLLSYRGIQRLVEKTVNSLGKVGLAGRDSRSLPWSPEFKF